MDAACCDAPPGLQHFGGCPSGLILDARQQEEVFLTSAQSLFALAVILNFRMSVWEAFGLIFLFVTQLFFTDTHIRYIYAFTYLGLAVIIIARHPDRLRNLFQASCALVAAARRVARRSSVSGKKRVGNFGQSSPRGALGVLNPIREVSLSRGRFLGSHLAAPRLAGA